MGQNESHKSAGGEMNMNESDYSILVLRLESLERFIAHEPISDGDVPNHLLRIRDRLRRAIEEIKGQQPSEPEAIEPMGGPAYIRR